MDSNKKDVVPFGTPAEDAKLASDLSARAAKELDSVRKPPSGPGFTFWTTVLLLFGCLVLCNDRSFAAALEPVVERLGLANTRWLVSVALIAMLYKIYVHDRFVRIAGSSSKVHWVQFGFGRSDGTSWKPELRFQGKAELTRLLASAHKAGVALRRIAWTLVAAASPFLAYAIAIFAAGNEFAQFRPLTLSGVVAACLLWTAVMLFEQSEVIGPDHDDIEGAVALHCECDEERQEELRRLHRRA